MRKAEFIQVTNCSKNVTIKQYTLLNIVKNYILQLILWNVL